MSLDEPLRSEGKLACAPFKVQEVARIILTFSVVGSYRRACTTAFNWCAFGALIIAMSLAKIKMEAFKKEGSFEMEETHDEDRV